MPNKQTLDSIISTSQQEEVRVEEFEGVTVEGAVGVSSQPTWSDIPTGRRFGVSYEPQVGQPIDGGSDQLRNFAPFQIQFDFPDDLEETLASLSPTEDAFGGIFAVETAYNTATGNEFTNYSEGFLEEATFQQFYNPDHSPAFAGAIQVSNYASQISNMHRMPPLQVLVNPTSMSISYTKVQDFGTRTRKNRIFRAWGEEQPTITFSFTTGGFIAGQQRHFWTSVENTPSGLQYASKKLSAAWQNFMKIFHMYQNMGLFYDTVFDTEAHLGVGGLRIDYDQMAYFGLIESFDFTYDAESPNKLAFEVSFVVSKMLDLSDSSKAILPQTNPNDPSSNNRFGDGFLDIVEGI